MIPVLVPKTAMQYWCRFQRIWSSPDIPYNGKTGSESQKMEWITGWFPEGKGSLGPLTDRFWIRKWNCFLRGIGDEAGNCRCCLLQPKLVCGFSVIASNQKTAAWPKIICNLLRNALLLLCICLLLLPANKNSDEAIYSLSGGAVFFQL